MEELKLSLTVDEINLILGGLGELPYKTVGSLISKIITQSQAQFKTDDVSVSESVDKTTTDKKS